MVLGFPLLLSLLAVDRAQPDLSEFDAYMECRSARRFTTVRVVGVEDAWLRAGEAPESPTKGILHRGQEVTLLKRGSRSLLVKTEENRKGWLWNEEVIERVVPPQVPFPAYECPQPGFLEGARPPLNYLLPQRAILGPDSAVLESLNVDMAPSGHAADSGSGAPR